jgi:curved DNA-binding protein
MTGSPDFIDYYSVLQVSPSCDAKTLELAYHRLAKACHPDHTGTADTTKFNELSEAYKVLRSPDQRAQYDLLFTNHNKKEWFEFFSDNDVGVDEKVPLNDADDHARILMFLYRKRRESAQKAGVVGYYLQEMLKCSDEHFEFHKWYLKEKGFIVVTEDGTLAITIQGIDHVISMSRTTTAEKLLIAQSNIPRTE